MNNANNEWILVWWTFEKGDIHFVPQMDWKETDVHWAN